MIHGGHLGGGGGGGGAVGPRGGGGGGDVETRPIVYVLALVGSLVTSLWVARDALFSCLGSLYYVIRGRLSWLVQAIAF